MKLQPSEPNHLPQTSSRWLAFNTVMASYGMVCKFYWSKGVLRIPSLTTPMWSHPKRGAVDRWAPQASLQLWPTPCILYIYIQFPLALAWVAKEMQGRVLAPSAIPTTHLPNKPTPFSSYPLRNGQLHFWFCLSQMSESSNIPLCPTCNIHNSLNSSKYIHSQLL